MILPMETKVRELQAKVLLACMSAEAGFRVVLGDQNEILRCLGCVPRGIYVDKGIAGTNTPNIVRNRGLGNRVVAWCEEGLSFRFQEAYLKERLSPRAYNAIDRFFAWGPHHEETVRMKFPEEDGKVLSTGNPRFDVLRDPYRRIFQAEAERIRSLHGPFILVNTNFSRYNHFYGRDYVFQNLRAAGRLNTEEEKAFFVGLSDHLRRLFSHFVDMVERLSEAFPRHAVVIRPHPSENQETWRERTRGLPNVRVALQGSVVPWIMASEIMIHNSCTTGVEAWVLEQPAACYLPVESRVYDAELPNALAPHARSVEGIVRLIEEAARDPVRYVERAGRGSPVAAVAARYLCGIEGETASERVVETLLRIVEDHPALLRGDRLSPADRARGRLRAQAVLAARLLRGWVRETSGLRRYLDQKFPGLEVEEVQGVIEGFRAAAGRFHHVNAVPFPGVKSCVRISAET